MSKSINLINGSSRTLFQRVGAGSAVQVAKGQHAIIEHTGAISRFSCAQLEVVLTKAAVAAGATVLSAHFHDFGDRLGNTGVLMLAESHISIHTWPENNYAAIDIFICHSSAHANVQTMDVAQAQEAKFRSVDETANASPINKALNVLQEYDEHGLFHCQLIQRGQPMNAAHTDAVESDDSDPMIPISNTLVGNRDTERW